MVNHGQVKIKAGKYYRTREGEKVGPMEYDGDGDYRAMVGMLGSCVRMRKDGIRSSHWSRMDGASGCVDMRLTDRGRAAAMQKVSSTPRLQSVSFG